MNIIFVGGFFPEQFIDEILSKSKHQVQNAANTFQWAFIKGLEKNLGRPIKLVTAPYVGWYPKYYNDLFIKSVSFANGDKHRAGSMVGFFNIPLLKNAFKYFGILKSIKCMLDYNDDNIVIVYSLDAAYLKASLDAKALNPNIKICVIIPDLHEFPGDANYLYKWYIKFIEKPIFYNLLARIDCFVVLTDKMVNYLDISHKPWERIEGLYEVNDISPLQRSSAHDNCKTILYTGTLDYKYGIKELLDAFELITSDEYRLWICGGGVGADLVRRRALADKRIKYFGIVPKQRVTELQCEATLLINPRNSVGEYNKYSFPSKTMEYFASGTPTLMYRLDGIPDEYFNYCYTISGDDVASMSDAMYRTCQIDHDVLASIGHSAREFILKFKNSEFQCSKVIQMFDAMIK